jgi:hypothetical protein
VGPDTSYNGGHDAFVAKVNPSGTGLVYAGFLGGSNGDGGKGIAVDAAGNAYVTGWTLDSSNFPAVVGPDTSYNGGDDAFVAKVNPSGTGLVYAGFLGGSAGDEGWASPWTPPATPTSRVSPIPTTSRRWWDRTRVTTATATPS